MSDKIIPHPDQMIVGIAFPPTVFEKKDLTDIYGAISQRYDYAQFALANPGALITGPNGNMISILPDRIQIIDAVGLTFNSSKEKVIDIVRNIFFKTIQNKIKPPFALGCGIKLISRTQIAGNEQSAAEFVSKNLHISPEQLKLLGDENMWAGIRLHFKRPPKEFDIRMEPWFTDPSKLWVELDIQLPGGPLPAVLSAVEGEIESARQFLIKDLADFLQHLRI